MASPDLSRESSLPTEEFQPVSSPSPTFQAGISPIATLVSPMKRVPKRSMASFHSKTVLSSSTALSATADDSPQPQRPSKLCKKPPLPRSKPVHTPSDAFQAWLKAKEDAASLAKRRKQTALEEEKRSNARRERMNKQAMKDWRDQHEAKLREKKANEKNLQRLARIHRHEEAQRSVEHDILCRQKFQQWVKEKLKAKKTLSASQYTLRLSPKLIDAGGSQDRTSPQLKASVSEAGSPKNQIRLSLETFGVSITGANRPPSDFEDSF